VATVVSCVRACCDFAIGEFRAFVVALILTTRSPINATDHPYFLVAIANIDCTCAAVAGFSSGSNGDQFTPCTIHAFFRSAGVNGCSFVDRKDAPIVASSSTTPAIPIGLIRSFATQISNCCGVIDSISASISVTPQTSASSAAIKYLRSLLSFFPQSQLLLMTPRLHVGRRRKFFQQLPATEARAQQHLRV